LFQALISQGGKWLFKLQREQKALHLLEKRREERKEKEQKKKKIKISKCSFFL